MNEKLQHILLSFRPGAEWITQSAADIEAALLTQSKFVRTRNFTAIHPSDLAFLFDQYDQTHFNQRCLEALNGVRPNFRLAPRMTSNAGKTTRFFIHATREVKFEIAIASSMLYDCFREDDHRPVMVNGHQCKTRIEALMRIFEHEMVHLAEQLAWRHSNCSAPRFHDIAERFFGHRAPHKHSLITRKEKMAQSGLRVGSQVQFEFEGLTRIGLLNKVTKRATVLVLDEKGQRYSDGKRYLKFYVPIPSLRQAKP